MKTMMFACAIVLVLLCVTTASANWTYVVPVQATAVYTYWPAAPVYVSPRWAVAPAPVVVSAPVAYPTTAVAPAVVVFPKAYVYGRPVRNVLRAVTP